MLAPLRRCADGWPCMVGDLQGHRMRTGSKIRARLSTENHESYYNFYYSSSRPYLLWKASPSRWTASKSMCMLSVSM